MARCLLSSVYAPPAVESPRAPLVHGGSGNRRAVLRLPRSKAFAVLIRDAVRAAGASERDLADVLYVDPKNAHAIMAGGGATSEELHAALAAFGRRAA